jgi:hypothetical protein
MHSLPRCSRDETKTKILPVFSMALASTTAKPQVHFDNYVFTNRYVSRDFMSGCWTLATILLWPGREEPVAAQ